MWGFFGEVIGEQSKDGEGTSWTMTRKNKKRERNNLDQKVFKKTFIVKQQLTSQRMSNVDEKNVQLFMNYIRCWRNKDVGQTVMEKTHVLDQ